jgi:hypothetical protein
MACVAGMGSWNNQLNMTGVPMANPFVFDVNDI